MLKRFLQWLSTKLKRGTEKLLGRYAEGPEMPIRYAQAVMAFITMHPKASQGEWVQFAIKHAEVTFRAGYLRGVEWKERTPERIEQAVGTTLAEMAERHDWSWVDLAPAEQQLAEMVQTHPELIERLSPEQRAFYTDRIGRTMGGFRVVLVPSDDPKQR